MAQPVENIRIFEVADTNLLQVITDNEKDSTYYSKSNLEVSALDERLTLKNNGTVVLSVFPYQVLVPKEESVVDLVEIIQGYLNNIIPDNQEEVDILKDILSSSDKGNELLDIIRSQTQVQGEMLEQLSLSNKYLRKIYNPE